jgi:hypothetical protein
MNDFKCACPHCGQHIEGDGQWRGLQLICPACQTPMMVPQAVPVPTFRSNPPNLPVARSASPLGLPEWGRILWQVVLGALTPFVVSAAMAVTCLLGSLAWVAAPLLGGWVSFGLARHCHSQPKPTRFWVYVVAGLVAYSSMLLGPYLPAANHARVGEPSLAGAQAAMAGGLVMLLFLGSGFVWLIGVALAWVFPRSETASFP